MSSGFSGRQVLAIGLDPCRMPGPWDPEPVSKAIDVGMAGLADQGINACSAVAGRLGKSVG
ncbi:MAG: hypothetical protein HKN91_01655 [Acidimicrobiia bacterium]|nr:hypothetical protein [Acidimicrobiia bacterium]